MTTKTETRILHEVVRRCVDEQHHTGRWIIQRYFRDGRAWDDRDCPHFRSLKHASDYIHGWADAA